MQYVRKISGFTKPSATNEVAFERAVDEVTAATLRMMASLVTSAAPRDRDAAIERAKRRSADRFPAKPRIAP